MHRARDHDYARVSVKRPGGSPSGRRPGTFAVGGRRVVAEAVRSGRAKRVLAVGYGRRSEGLHEVIAAAEKAGVAIEWVAPAELERLVTGPHQGVGAIVEPPAELDQRALASTRFAEDAIVVVLDGIEDPQNMGACARAAEAAGAAMLITRRRRAAPLSPAAFRASAGALLHLPVARVANVTRAIEALRDHGFSVVGLDQRAPEDIHGSPAPPRPLALVVGSEGAGVSRLVREACDQLVAIPMAGRTASLNAAAALAVGLFGYALRP
jgi:23S rRNA (guanosine2251-2'-O)-methyltransferase